MELNCFLATILSFIRQKYNRQNIFHPKLFLTKYLNVDKQITLTDK